MVIMIALSSPNALVQARLGVPWADFGLPLLNFIAPLVTFCALFAFAAWFERTISWRLALSAISLNILCVVLFYAALHSHAGVICGTICPNGGYVSDDAVGKLLLGDGFAKPTLLVTLPEGADPSDYLLISQDFWTSLYFSVVTLTTLGYGDFQPLPQFRILAAFEAMSGYLILGLVVGLLIDFGARRRQDDQEIKALLLDVLDRLPIEPSDGDPPPAETTKGQPEVDDPTLADADKSDDGQNQRNDGPKPED
jgi:hypothetical protein